MAEAQQSTPEDFSAVLVRPAGLFRLAAAAPKIVHAVIFAAKPFFGAIGRTSNASVLNALGFFLVTLLGYVGLLVAFDETLIRAGYEADPLTSYYAYPFTQNNIPFAPFLGFLAALGEIAGQALFNVTQWTIGIWFLVTAFVHAGKIAPINSMFIAGLYATGAIMLVFSVLSVPMIYFDQTFNQQAFLATPGTLFYDIGRFATATGLHTKYQLVFTYLYLRSVSFTTDLRLHWGFVFTILLAALAILVARAI